MANSSNIDIPGLLRNSLNGGVGILAAISEEIDNSLSAGSSEIRMALLLDSNELIISDDGEGMTRDELKQSCCLHSRNVSSSDRHGRFGFGGKQSQITMTNLEGPVTKFSSTGGCISQITIDFPEILRTGVYYPHPHGIERERQNIWDNNAIKPQESGTVIHMVVPNKKRNELHDLMLNNTVAGLRFNFATRYRDALERGVNICIRIDNVDQYRLFPIDRMCSWAPPTTTMRETYYMDIMTHNETDETVSVIIPTEGPCTCLDKLNKNFVPVSSELLNTSTVIGRATCTLAYSNEWNRVEKDALEKNGIIPLNKGQSGIGKFRTETNGTELVRNGKVIKHFPTKEKKSGDHDLGIQTAQTRMRIEFQANESMDTHFNVQVNKSQVNEDLINPNVWKTIERIKQRFISECAKMIQEMDAPAPAPALAPAPAPAQANSMRLDVTEITQSHSPSSTLSPSNTYESIEDEDEDEDEDENEDEDESEDEDENENEDEDEEDDENENELPQADLVHEVGPSTRGFITRSKGETILHTWLVSNNNQSEMNEILDSMHIEYSNVHNWMALNQFKPYLDMLTLEQKYSHLIKLMRTRHPKPEEYMLKGRELLRAYADAFGIVEPGE
jgi:hypothetical protein